MNVEKLLKRDEGFVQLPYRDKLGHLTFGYGYNIEAGISVEDAEMLLESRIKQIRKFLDQTMEWWKNLDDVRQAVFISMCYNLGEKGFVEFTKMLDMAKIGQYTGAANEIMNSKAARELTERYERFAHMMDKGVWVDEQGKVITQ